MSRFDSAFILAAGEGTRMRPFTEHTPKPMVEIGGETLIKRIIGQCRGAGIEHLYANSFHLAEKLEDHVKDDGVIVLREEALLNTGLGIKRVLPHIKNEPFYGISGDSWWHDGDTSVFEQMDKTWTDDIDLLLVLQRIDGMDVTPGVGDYTFVDGKPVRSLEQKGTHIWTSLRLLHPRLFDNTPDVPFSFLEVMDRAQTQGRLGAIELDGVWQHLTTQDDITAVNTWLKNA